ncbi:NFACT family protein [Paenibacillus sp. FJAT-26967]|uniref:Rqc2 family fibronectin-binding protein n=1 Tax=Paenibacillus sp. FJAT-26967 TaxID=1729690 RepID=UPI000838FDD3|nr:NFACT RNA binding domain-containing protein [Paenibacillus sp. FJAT-26967]
MALDGLVLHAIVHELQECVGGRINKIHQPTGSDIVMQIRARGRSLKLLLSANPTYPRMNVTEQSYSNPQEAPMFCMLLRKHCEGGIIDSIEQVGLERIVHFRIRQRDELGDVSTKTIVVEIMGRHSNLILMDPSTGTILDGIHHVTPAISSYRIIMPGSAYVEPPEQDKANPLDTSEAVFRRHMTSGIEEGNPPEQQILRSFSGISPLASREIVHRSGVKAGEAYVETDLAPLWQSFRSVTDAVRERNYTPVIVEDSQSGKLFFSVTELTHIDGEVQIFPTISECLESYYGDKAERDTVKQRAADLVKLLQNEKAKNLKKIEKLRETKEAAQDADRFRIMGELLTAHLHEIRKGDKKAAVTNYYEEDQPQQTIVLDPLLTPSENAQRYFKKYTKSKNSLAYVEQQLVQAEMEIEYLSSLLQQLGTASLRDIEEIRDELAEQGYVRQRSGKGKRKKKTDKPSVSCFTSSEGLPIYVGKNNTQNDYVTNRLASSGDTWLHTKDIPGSHVVIRSQSFGEATLHEAAQLAAYYSQARESSSVPVDYTLVRHVHKPSGAKPGFVIYEQQKTLFVTPDTMLIKQLPQTVKA